MAEARTVAEAYAYLELTLPPGESWVDYEKYTTLEAGRDSGYVLRFDGWYEGRRHRLDVPVVARDGQSTLIDAGQWHLLAEAYAGMAVTGEEQLAGVVPDDETYRAIVGAWDGAATAVAEIEQFLPGGGPDVAVGGAAGVTPDATAEIRAMSGTLPPPGRSDWAMSPTLPNGTADAMAGGAAELTGEAFWTEAGRRVWAHRPEAFERARLAAARAEYARRRDDFVARYGTVAPATAAETGAVRPARTYGEAHAYMDLHPCVCGSAAFPRGQLAVTASDEDGATVRFAGPCDDCDRLREFAFRLPPRPGVPAESPYLFSYPSDGPSELLDAGEWFGVAEGFAAVADAVVEAAADGRGVGEAAVAGRVAEVAVVDAVGEAAVAGRVAEVAVVDAVGEAAAGGRAVEEAAVTDPEDGIKMFTCAASAIDEVLRFLPPGAAVLPPAALWTEDGRERYARDPDRFRRASLEEWRAERWRHLTEFTARHGR